MVQRYAVREFTATHASNNVRQSIAAGDSRWLAIGIRQFLPLPPAFHNPSNYIPSPTTTAFKEGAEDGCDFSATKDARVEHERICCHRKHKCPFNHKCQATMTMAEMWEHLNSHPESYYATSSPFRSATPGLSIRWAFASHPRTWKEFVRVGLYFPLLCKLSRPGSSTGVAVLIVLRGAPSAQQTPTEDSPLYANAFVLGAGVAENDLRVTVTFELEDGQKAVLTTKAKASSGSFDISSGASDIGAFHPSDTIGIPASMMQPVAGQPKGTVSASVDIQMAWLDR